MTYILLFTLILIAADGAFSGKCWYDHNKTEKSLLGAFKPTCNIDGSYNRIQCRESYCYCVDKESGEQISGTGTMGALPICPKPPGIKNCFDRVNINAEPLFGSYTPDCNPDGSYKEVQCYEGSCFCVNKESGEEVNGKRYEGSPPDCNVGFGECKKEMDMVTAGLIGVYVPQCKPDGSYEEKQCHSSIGHCWCVDNKLGKEISGSRKHVAEGEVMCGFGECKKELDMVKAGLIGVYVPQCKPDGSYEEKQCHSSTGHCWCVDRKLGKEIPGSRKHVAEGEVMCGLAEKGCVSHRRTSTSNGLLGTYIPQCNADGSYGEKQCHEGSCFCVNTITGEETLGTRKRGEVKTCNTECIRDRHAKLRFIMRTSFLGIPTPECGEDGAYKKSQCIMGPC